MRRICVVILFGLAGSFSQFASSEPTVRTEGFVSTDDGTELYYVENGSGTDVLVAPVALYLEPHLLEDLAKSRRVIFYDPRNRGRSDSADLSSISLDRQIEDLESLRKALGIEKMSPVPPAASIMRESGDAGAGSCSKHLDVGM